MAIYMWREAAPITTAGVYHSPDLGLISLSSDGNTWITIADKNLGATQVYNSGDTLSQANCGKYYQRGNNYGFPRTGTVTISNNEVDASTYGPGNYYNSSTFITSSYIRDISYNDNLWGNTTNTNEARKGPCGSGYHVPTNTEWQNVYQIGATLGLWSSSSTQNTKQYLKLPRAGYRSNNGGVANTSTGHVANAHYWSSTPIVNSEPVYGLFISSSVFYPQYGTYRVNGYSIRPFANTPVQPDETWEVLYEYHEPDYLCFTANTAGSAVQLTRTGIPTAVNLEISTDGSTWSDYTLGSNITLSNEGDKVYFRNTSTTTTGFNVDSANYYCFYLTGSIAASGDVTYLVNKNGTTDLNTSTTYCFLYLFNDCVALTTPPKLPATTLGLRSYNYMFINCTNLEALPELPATEINSCYYSMFNGCRKIKLSTTKTGEYQTPYRIPKEGTGTKSSDGVYYMFDATGGTFTGTPSINTTYYTSNQVI